jgi:hypothetical protein
VLFDEEPDAVLDSTIPGLYDNLANGNCEKETTQFVSKGEFLPASPAVEILRYEARPTSTSLKWLG